MATPKKRIRAPQQTRKAVLKAAERLFAKSGFAGTSMRDISRASRVSQPLIHHHFGSKRELYTAVHEYAVRCCRNMLEPTLDAKEFGRKRLLDALGRFFSLVGRNEAMRRLCAWSMLEGDGRLWPGEAEFFQMARGRIEEAQAQGEVRRDVQPFFLTVMALSLVRHWWEYREVYAELLGKASTVAAEPDGKLLDESYLSQLLCFMNAALAPPKANERQG